MKSSFLEAKSKSTPHLIQRRICMKINLDKYRNNSVLEKGGYNFVLDTLISFLDQGGEIHSNHEYFFEAQNKIWEGLVSKIADIEGYDSYFRIMGNPRSIDYPEMHAFVLRYNNSFYYVDYARPVQKIWKRFTTTSTPIQMRWELLRSKAPSTRSQ